MKRMSDAQRAKIAIIPARGGSKRFPRKNISLLAQRPLLEYPIETALKSGIFSRVIVSTEDQEISLIAKQAGAEVFQRSENLSTDTAHELEACREILEHIRAQGQEVPSHFCVIYPTAVFVRGEDIAKAAELFEQESSPQVVISVSEFNYHPYKALEGDSNGFLIMKHPTECVQPSQKYPPLVASNGTFYWLETRGFLINEKNSYYYSSRVSGYRVDADRAVDINYPEDLRWVELLMTTRKEGEHEL